MLRARSIAALEEHPYPATNRWRPIHHNHHSTFRQALIRELAIHRLRRCLTPDQLEFEQLYQAGAELMKYLLGEKMINQLPRVRAGHY